MTDLTDRTIDYLIDARMESSGGRDHRADLVQGICVELAAIRGVAERIAAALVRTTDDERPANVTVVQASETEAQMRVELCRAEVVRVARKSLSEDGDATLLDLVDAVRRLDKAEAIRDAEIARVRKAEAALATHERIARWERALRDRLIPHDHLTREPGCYQCELSVEEAGR
ncbi:MAG: hypothetical protein KA249_12175 [Dermatophilaceae bacterium]|nr:hypothetical protein [Dermatophilaceae bacterium]